MERTLRDVEVAMHLAKNVTQVKLTPAICDNRIYLRSAKTSSTRQEFLRCDGE